MTNFWNWLKNNAEQLQALAAITAVIAVIAAAPIFVMRWLKPDLLLKYYSLPSTVPPELEHWLSEAGTRLDGLPDAPDDGEDDYESLRPLQDSGPIAIGRRGRWATEKPSLLRIDVINQVDRAIPGVRLRLEHAYTYWGIDLDATFLTAEESEAWENAVSPDDAGPTVVLPELPPIPPESSVTVFIYGDVEGGLLSATAPGVSYEIVRMELIEDRFPASLILRPYLALILVPLSLLGLMVLVGCFAWVQQRAQQRAARTVTYNLACSEAVAGRAESAIALLNAALNSGYDNLDFIRTDPDLESLRQLDEFKDLVSRNA